MLPFPISRAKPTATIISLHSPAACASPPTSKPAFAALLRSCSSRPAHLKQAHALLLTTGLSRKNGLITQILQSLTLSGDMNYARSLFDEMHKPRVFLWNTLMRGYIKNGLAAEAADIYRRMHRTGIRPDNFTFPNVLKACAELLDGRTGKAAHGLLVNHGMGFDAIVRTELMAMYAKTGDSDSADEIFGSLRGSRDLVSWNALISAYAQNGQADKAVALFQQMEASGVEPDQITLVCALTSCAYLGSLEMGKQLHLQIKQHALDVNVFVENALIDMYTKCGCMDEAVELFEAMGQKTVVSWSTMIGGYAINGDSKGALSLFCRMRDEGVQPNDVTMLAVLSACSHAGLVNEGKKYFSNIVNPRIEHYATMVDLLGRSGHLEEAYNFIRNMAIEPDAGVWGALLGTCTICHNTELGQVAADELLSLAPDSPSYRVLLSNIYAASGRWDDVERVRERMRGDETKKVAGYSSVELGKKVHLFYEGSRSRCKEIYRKLDELTERIKGMGYAPETSVVLHDVELEEKEGAVRAHSEKLAIAFSIIHSKNHDAPLRVMKNLRICCDCHTFCKYVSKALGREITMRDKNRFHRFRDGQCSCGDFW